MPLNRGLRIIAIVQLIGIAMIYSGGVPRLMNASAYWPNSGGIGLEFFAAVKNAGVWFAVGCGIAFFLIEFERIGNHLLGLRLGLVALFSTAFFSVALTGVIGLWILPSII